MRFKTVIMIFVWLFLSSCINANKNDYPINDIRIFKNTSAWRLALAVKDQRWWSIRKIAKENPKLLNYQEPKYGATLLLWAIGTEKYKSVETLLACDANPDIASKIDGETPLFLAAGYSWIDIGAKKDPKYVKLLLRHGADPNKCYMGNKTPGETNFTEPGTSPLMNSIGCGIEKTKALVEAGADINYKTKSGRTAAIIALDTQEFPEYARYLIVEKKAKVVEPYFIPLIEPVDPNDLRAPVDILRDWVFALDSPKYKVKMEIVKEFERQGVSYWDTKIPKFMLEYIKKLYPQSWQEYIKKY